MPPDEVPTNGPEPEGLTAEKLELASGERYELALQASLMERYASRAAADAFVATRLDGEGGRQIGTLPAGIDFDAIISTAWID